MYSITFQKIYRLIEFRKEKLPTINYWLTRIRVTIGGLFLYLYFGRVTDKSGFPEEFYAFVRRHHRLDFQRCPENKAIFFLHHLSGQTCVSHWFPVLILYSFGISGIKAGILKGTQWVADRKPKTFISYTIWKVDYNAFGYIIVIILGIIVHGHTLLIMY